MSFAFSSALQKGIYGALTQDDTLLGLIGKAVYSTVPYGSVPDVYIIFFAEKVSNASDYTVSAAIHELTLSVHTPESEYKKAQDVAARVSTLLPSADITLESGHLEKVRFLRAAVRRYENSQRRRIDLQFRAFIRA